VDAVGRKTKADENYQVRKPFWRIGWKEKAFLSTPAASLHMHGQGSICPAPYDLASEKGKANMPHEGGKATGVFSIPSFLPDNLGRNQRHR